ncbi:hypothetical protein L798_10136 [Zootermopsis nevadensis]|uniref:Uncharacterized protein n=1 Tax=Zootermopsis nevadensis TaxID=136037 RepID=A0A067R0D0_ZOONE|nr:hypothetical protein L798_10136 [Zootermopsis nevadensis]
MESSTFWEDSSSVHQHVKFESFSSTEGSSSRPYKEEQSIFRYCDGNLNFATAATSEDDEYSVYHKKKVSRVSEVRTQNGLLTRLACFVCPITNTLREIAPHLVP